MFDCAARAVQSALEIRTAVHGIGLDIRVGVHTGEVEVVPGGIRGLAVHETARIMALGNAEISSSRTLPVSFLLAPVSPMRITGFIT
jgi:class 3 adenylate cyclase